ncbi:hypothetical protein MWU65_07285 [Cellulophaga sp. F20128]|uniref:tetratricopeptide repeat protein n=1 Tax=Cellulophaga sp. F20128 TaxID=2926413 RepID=UPI001FF600A7|nr:hypothetical protein [Cellulophaga sp. F20128]MCK0156978.1 hypothetical protein [Cellulophaga sp. F20128]
MKHLIVLMLLVSVVSCNLNGPKQITDSKDYNGYLGVEMPETTSKYYELWNSKIKPDSMQLISFGNVAAEYNRYFKNTGNIEYLKKAEQCLARAVEIAGIGKAGYYRALARNYISQHKFNEALVMAHAAQKTGSGLEESENLLFDVHMELGNYIQAEKYLTSIKNKNNFGYLIRVAKWNDYIGNLDATIMYMEKAKKMAEMAKDNNLKIWSYTNLADYYGHAGRIKDSYNHYLKSLQLEPHNAYAKKGIAWIVYSYERNPNEALRILNSITENYSSPDYFLLKTEIAEYQNNRKEVLRSRDNYLKAVENPAYGNMYNSHNVSFYLDHTVLFEKAVSLAKEEMKNRKTPESYMLLARSLFKNGDVDAALKIVQEQVDGQTFEPHILYNSATIYKAVGNHKKVKEIKEELSEAIYELGPNMEQKIAAL